MFIRKLSVLFAGLALSASAWAIPFSAGFTIDSNDLDPGLVVETRELASNPFAFDLEENESYEFDLFRIWTNESDAGWDDFVAKPITANFTFSQPDIISGGIGGKTLGLSVILAETGAVFWEDPLDLIYGTSNSGLFRIELFSTLFNADWFGLAPGERNGADVKARITLVRAASVPEPGTLALLGLGLVAIGVSLRRV